MKDRNNIPTKTCKRRGCKNICMLPAWVYCSDRCGKFENKMKVIDKKRKLSTPKS